MSERASEWCADERVQGVVNITWTFAAPEAPAGNDTGNSTETKVLADEVITASIYTGFGTSCAPPCAWWEQEWRV